MKENHLHALSHSLDLLKDTYNYNHWIYSLLRRYHGGDVCEVGAGTGNLTQFFLNASRVLCVEPEEEYCAVLRKLAAVHLNLEVFKGGLAECARIPSVGGAFDTVVCVNVLEHIKDDGEAVDLMKSLLKADGRLLLYVPAAPWAYGQLDRQLGHYRRYSRKMIRSLSIKCGIKLEHCIYVNFPGAFGWFLHSRIMGRTMIAPENARAVDRLVPFISAVERLLPPITGQSIFAVMRKTDA